MKDEVGECLLGDSEDCTRGAPGAPDTAEQTKPGSGVVWNIKPVESSRLGSLSSWHRLGLRARLAEQTRLPSSVAPARPACRSKCSSETTLVEGYVHGNANILLGSLKRWLPMNY